MKKIMRKLRIFTDGACSGNPGPGGWGSIFAYDENLVKISGFEKNTTNNRMELLSVVKSLEKVSNDVEEFDVIEINSDSAYVVNAVNQNWIEVWKKNNWKTSKSKNVKNYDLWKRFIEVIDVLDWLKIKVVFVKVKGHAGNSLNEMVDELARSEIIKNVK
ncbi:MAG: ribonuclease HI [Methanobrevibacter sp.]|nr:ribonuclease HI [Methanobrevibacter sp.]